MPSSTVTESVVDCSDVTGTVVGISHRAVRIGTIWVDVLSFAEALNEIESLVDAKRGGAIFTPNVDHVVKAASNEPFRRAYENVSLSLADGMPLVWAARLLGCPLPGRVAGSELVIPLIEVAARRRWRVYLIGGAPGVAQAAAQFLIKRRGVHVVGWDSPLIQLDGSDISGDSIARAAAAQADLILVALGAPKQELWIQRAASQTYPAVALGIGGSLDFIIGRYKKAPRWMAGAGLEWLFRLIQEPRRLWRRYLVEGPRFFGIVAETWRAAPSSRIANRPSTYRHAAARLSGRHVSLIRDARTQNEEPTSKAH